MRTRWWLERGVIVVAALATIATSRRKWHLDAELPKSQDTKIARLVVVEASRAPRLTVRDADGSRYDIGWEEEGEPRWPGKVTFLVRADKSIDRAYLVGDPCSSGCMPGSSSACEAGPDEYLRIAKVTPVATWRIEAAGAAQTTSLDTSKIHWSHPVEMTASHPPALWLEVAPELPANSRPIAYYKDGRATVTWPYIEKPVTVTWVLHAAIEQPCPGVEPCKPPAGARLSIGAIGELEKPPPPPR